jgi:hypothetical protein
MRSIGRRSRAAGVCFGAGVALGFAIVAPTSQAGIGSSSAALAAGTPLGAAGGQPAPSAMVYGGMTGQQWPVMVELSSDRMLIARSGIGLDLKCASGYEFLPDSYKGVPVSKTGRIRASYGPVRVDRSDGSFDVFQSRMTGTSNRARTRLAGTWRLVDAEHDATGALTDTCDSGTVHWTAKR